MLKYLLCWVLAASWGPLAFAVSEGPAYERVELNWDTMRIRFYGVSAKIGTLKETEDEAIKEGVAYIAEALPAIREANLEEKYLGRAFQKDLVKGVSRNTYTYSTTYFQDGKVKVDLESSLASALFPAGLKFTKDEPESDPGPNTGLMILVEGSLDPQMIYEIRNEDGDSLYRLKDVARNEFAKNFMGRFFYQKGSRKIKYYLGDKPLEIKAKSQGDRVLLVDGDRWEKLMEDNYHILERARVAVVSR